MAGSCPHLCFSWNKLREYLLDVFMLVQCNLLQLVGVVEFIG